MFVSALRSGELRPGGLFEILWGSSCSVAERDDRKHHFGNLVMSLVMSLVMHLVMCNSTRCGQPSAVAYLSTARSAIQSTAKLLLRYMYPSLVLRTPIPAGASKHGFTLLLCSRRSTRLCKLNFHFRFHRHRQQHRPF